jgi:hypothetical protein
MLAIFLMLMCTSSPALRGAMDVTVHNLSPDIELVSPTCFCNRGIYNEYPVVRRNVSAMKIGFSFGLDKLPGGILMYEMQRKASARSNHQSSTDTKTIEDISKMTRLLVAWKIEDTEEPKVYMISVEHDNELILNEDKLAQLYVNVNDQFSERYNPSRHTWLVYDDIVMEATYNVVQKEGLALEIAVSKGVKDWNTKPALWIDSKR